MNAPLIVLDDDPTGTQAVTQVPVLLEWAVEDLRAAASDGAGSIHLLTNSRALEPDRAHDIVAGAVRAARSALPDAHVLLRGDSTLRAHLLEEYLGVCEAAHGDRRPPILLVPALPAAGRITIDGVQLIERDGVRTPLHDTEYAEDPSFAYRDAHLLQWADDRSGGLFARERGRTVPLRELREEGARSVLAALSDLSRAGAPAGCAPDAETIQDLELIAEGLRLAQAAGIEVVVRGSPTFAGVLAGSLSVEAAPMPAAPHGVLLVCGSYVATTRRQLAALAAAHPQTTVEVDVLALADPRRAEAEIDRLASAVAVLLGHGKLAVLTTPSERPDGTRNLPTGERIAVNLARVVASVHPFPSVVVAKGGITSAVTARVGLDCRVALTVGPVLPGVALWHAQREGDGEVPYLIVPGNVGDDDLLVSLVERILEAG